MKPIIIQNKNNRKGFTPNKAIITPRSEKSVNLYFSEINKLDGSLLTREQEKELFIKINQGDESAKEKVIHSNLKFVISVAKNYMNQGLDFEDLINEGNIGLIKAVERFDHEKGFKFISFAVWWIRQNILQALIDKGKTVRIPINKNNSLNKVNQIISKLEQTLQRKPTMDEIVEHAQEVNKNNSLIKLNEKITKEEEKLKRKLTKAEIDKLTKENIVPEIDTDDITNILLSKMTGVSLDEPIYSKNGDEDGSLYDILPSTGISTISNMERIETEIKELLSNSGLTRQERNIIEMTYGVLREKKYNLGEISDMYSITSERIRQISVNALRKLRNNPKIQLLFEYTTENN